MFLNTIYEEDFHNFLKNPTDFILSGVVMNEKTKEVPHVHPQLDPA